MKSTMENPVLVSGCGSYIALMAGNDLQIHTVSPPSLLRRFNVTKSLQKHITNHGVQGSHSKFEVVQMEWEITKDRKATKIAVYAASLGFHALLLLDLKEDDPVIIEQDPIGVDSFQWLMGSAGGAYKNCTQLAVFVKYSLELRVYSLDCTHVLFSVPKPLSGVLTRPDSKIWSVVLAPYGGKHHRLMDNRSPVLLHFYNEGSTSMLLASLRLEFLDLALAEWSPLGKWLSVFDAGLAGYSLKIFNSLGIHTKPVEELILHTAQATIETRYDKGSDWLSLWTKVDSNEFILVFGEESSKNLNIRVHGITLLASTAIRVLLDLAWVYSGGKYRRALASPRGKWKHTYVFGSTVILGTDHYLVILEAQSNSPQLSFEVKACLSSPLTFLSAHSLPNYNVIVFSDHIAIINVTQESIEVKATSRYQFKQALVLQREAKITVVEETPSGPIWRQFGLREDNDDSNLQIMRNYHYLEENSKVVNLMKDVQHNEWGQKRKEDVTDTFQMNSKRRRGRLLD